MIKNKKSANVKIIKALRARIANVTMGEVASAYGTKRSTIYYLLDVSRADNVNIEALTKLEAAISKVEEKEKRQAEKLLQSLK